MSASLVPGQNSSLNRLIFLCIKPKLDSVTVPESVLESTISVHESTQVSSDRRDDSVVGHW